jgi:hypothetical protein
VRRLLEANAEARRALETAATAELREHARAVAEFKRQRTELAAEAAALDARRLEEAAAGARRGPARVVEQATGVSFVVAATRSSRGTGNNRCTWWAALCSTAAYPSPPSIASTRWRARGLLWRR